jgi:hypothetical protein
MKYNVLALLMLNFDESGEWFPDKSKQQPTKIYPQNI